MAGEFEIGEVWSGIVGWVEREIWMVGGKQIGDVWEGGLAKTELFHPVVHQPA
jgi:hypothetical protein